MSLKIKSALYANVGKVRTRNEDNFYVAGRSWEGKSIESKLATSEADRQLFAVFDGMGGEAHGDIAAKLAVERFARLSKDMKERTLKARDLTVNIQDANDDICEYMQTNKTRQMGATAAAVYVDENTIVSLNVGDSRIYRMWNGTLKQVSIDHTTGERDGVKGGLTQHLGIPSEEMAIVPAQTTEATKHGVRYLICSDGLTDMVSEPEIERALREEENLARAIEELGKMAMAAGGKDNITAIGVEIAEVKSRERLIRRLLVGGAILLALVGGVLLARHLVTQVFAPKTAATGIVLEQSALNLNIGESRKLNYEIYPKDAAETRVTWQSSDGNVAVVEEGVVRARGAGTATITATVVGTDIRYSCSISVD